MQRGYPVPLPMFFLFGLPSSALCAIETEFFLAECTGFDVLTLWGRSSMWACVHLLKGEISGDQDCLAF